MTDHYDFKSFFKYQMDLKGQDKSTSEATKEEIIEIAQQLLINYHITEFERQRIAGLAQQFEAELNLRAIPVSTMPSICTAEACLPPPPPPSPSTAAETLLRLKTAGIFGGPPVSKMFSNEKELHHHTTN